MTGRIVRVPVRTFLSVWDARKRAAANAISGLLLRGSNTSGPTCDDGNTVVNDLRLWRGGLMRASRLLRCRACSRAGDGGHARVVLAEREGQQCERQAQTGGNHDERATHDSRPNDIEFSGEKEGAPATDAESAAMRC